MTYQEPEQAFLQNWILSDEETDEKGNPIPVGLPACVIFNGLIQHTGGWPKRVDNAMYVAVNSVEYPFLSRREGYEKQSDLRLIDSCDLFFSWIISTGLTVGWKAKAQNAISKAVFFNYARLRCPKYEAIEVIPHYPPIKKVAYHLPERTKGIFQGTFYGLMKSLKPATAHDAVLLKAMLLTPLWGGPAGRRPAFVLLGPEGDTTDGRGVGKTTVTDIMGELYGSGIDFSADAEREEITKRLLTSASKRIVRVDNVKSKLSSDSFESLITTKYISGHQLYVGDQTIPNFFTWVITFNMPEFSKDMSERAIPIRLGRPRPDPHWWPNLSKKIEENRWRILWDIERILKEDPVCQLERHIRFPEWSMQVLARCTTDPKITDEIEARQQMLEDSIPVCDQFWEIIEARLNQYEFDGGMRGIGLKLKDTCYRVRRSLVTGWIREEMPHMSSKHIVSNVARDKPDWLIPYKTSESTKSGETLLGPIADGTRFWEFGCIKSLSAWKIEVDYRRSSRVIKSVKRKGLSLIPE